MRKFAILGLTILICLVVFTTLAVVNFAGIRDTAYQAMQGTILQPGHDWVVNTWVQIGALGFTYIAATILGIGIVGGLFLVFIVYGLFWQKLIQQKLLHKTESTVPTLPLQRTLSTPISTSTSPSATPIEQPQETKEEA